MAVKVLCFMILAIVLSEVTADYSKIQIKQLFSKVRSCVSPDADVIERVMYNRNVVKDKETLLYFECASEKMGWLNAERQFQPQLLSDFFAQNFDRAAIESTVNACSSSLPGESLGEQLYNFHQCFFSKFEIKRN
ncbi:uncharacterized protein LOC119766589 [Culex quinquefasciatus]|uniref:uncharacterized protein LOC119766589 n=1 Tax=Culex quinquefasciatus TaxID=7176 RepID=UPI0018E34571|nr:uncharacterized protein LOC119766589 [Culex quinquefasciatus]